MEQRHTKVAPGPSRTRSRQLVRPSCRSRRPRALRFQSPGLQPCPWPAAGRTLRRRQPMGSKPARVHSAWTYRQPAAPRSAHRDGMAVALSPPKPPANAKRGSPSATAKGPLPRPAREPEKPPLWPLWPNARCLPTCFRMTANPAADSPRVRPSTPIRPTARSSGAASSPHRRPAVAGSLEEAARPFPKEARRRPAAAPEPE